MAFARPFNRTFTLSTTDDFEVRCKCQKQLIALSFYSSLISNQRTFLGFFPPFSMDSVNVDIEYW